MLRGVARAACVRACVLNIIKADTWILGLWTEKVLKLDLQVPDKTSYAFRTVMECKVNFVRVSF